MRNAYHIIKRGASWAIKKEGNIKVSKVVKSKSEAKQVAQKYRKTGSDVIVHNSDGSIEEWQMRK